jgi:hypothetical protein
MEPQDKQVILSSQKARTYPWDISLHTLGPGVLRHNVFKSLARAIRFEGLGQEDFKA